MTIFFSSSSRFQAAWNPQPTVSLRMRYVQQEQRSFTGVKKYYFFMKK